jgi:uncharacterized protein
VLERRYAERPAEVRRRLAELNAALDDLPTRTYWELPVDAPLRGLDLPAPTVGDPRAVDTVAPYATVPTLIVAGWFDSFLQGSLDSYVTARAAGQQAALIVGPWSHDNQTGRVGDVDFGTAADAAGIDEGASLLTRELDWLDRHLKQEADNPPSRQPVLLFVMGTNQWRRLAGWPPESVDVPWYLHGGGRLSRDRPEPDSRPDAFDHDPSDPVPTRGGALLMPPEFPAGPCDQQQTEKHDDVLVYTSEPLTAALEVIGRVKLHLTAAATAPTADWVVRLCDVDTDGTSRNITDGILRTRQTHIFGPHGDQASQANDILIDLWSTAHVFLPGHRIRVQITASCFPRWDRSLRAASHIVCHDAARPSRLILPCT